jgi:hypothetical protein
MACLKILNKVAAFPLVILLVSLPAPVRADLDALLARMHATYGGGETPPALVERGRTASLRRGVGALERVWSGDNFRIAIDYAGGAEIRLLRGERAWQQGRPANPTQRGAMLLQARRIGLPWQLRVHRSSLVDQGESTDADGQRRHRVWWPLGPGLGLTVDIDPENGQLLRSEGTVDSGGARMVFATEYSAFRADAKPPFAARERHFALGEFIGETRLTEVVIAPPPPASMFEPPSE